MENAEVANTILDFIGTIDFGAPVPGSQISLFETTIRYLGGLLAGERARICLLRSPNTDCAQDMIS
jgi:hypothetical protein